MVVERGAVIGNRIFLSDQIVVDLPELLRRGVPMAVCKKTFDLYTRPPYAGNIVAVEPRVPIPAEQAQPFDCSRDAARHPRETKGLEYRDTIDAAAPCCGPDSCC